MEVVKTHKIMYYLYFRNFHCVSDGSVTKSYLNKNHLSLMGGGAKIKELQRSTSSKGGGATWRGIVIVTSKRRYKKYIYTVVLKKSYYSHSHACNVIESAFINFLENEAVHGRKHVFKTALNYGSCSKYTHVTRAFNPKCTTVCWRYCEIDKNKQCAAKTNKNILLSDC